MMLVSNTGFNADKFNDKFKDQKWIKGLETIYGPKGFNAATVQLEDVISKYEEYK